MSAVANKQAQILKDIAHYEGIKEARKAWENSSISFDTKEKIKGVAALVFGTFAAILGTVLGLSLLLGPFARIPESSILSVIAPPTIGILLFGGSCVYAYTRFTLPSDADCGQRVEELKKQLES